MRVTTSAMALLSVLAACATSRAEQRRSGLVGTPLVLTAPDLDDREVDLGALQGQVRVIDFWATWCEPCKEAMPALDRMARELGPRGLAVYGVSIDEDRARISQYLRERPVSFPILWDRDSVRLTRLGVTFMPVTVIADRGGIIRHVHQGWDSGRAHREREEVEALLRE